MASEENDSTQTSGSPARRLATWPLALLGLTLAILLLANTVSAWGRRDAHDIDDFKSHADHFLDRALDRLDATDEQSTAIRAIVMSTIDDLHGTRDEFKLGRDEFRNLLTASAVDREALEALRQSHLARADEVSRTLANNLVDIIELLTPEQREELEEHFEKHGGRHGHGRWGGH